MPYYLLLTSFGEKVIIEIKTVDKKLGKISNNRKKNDDFLSFL